MDFSTDEMRARNRAAVAGMRADYRARGFTPGRPLTAALAVGPYEANYESGRGLRALADEVYAALRQPLVLLHVLLPAAAEARPLVTRLERQRGAPPDELRRLLGGDAPGAGQAPERRDFYFALVSRLALMALLRECGGLEHRALARLPDPRLMSVFVAGGGAVAVGVLGPPAPPLGGRRRREWPRRVGRRGAG
jgi:hypothetical protein